MQVPFEIDFVFPWVNNQDPVWRNTYLNYCKKHNHADKISKISSCRYRDWNSLRYLFRAIDTNMPWIRTIHLIVSNKEQIPEWLNTEKVHIVLHEDIIPASVLPTFNSGVIEMFIPSIPGLSEHFIYSNDDMFPVRLTQPTDWFTEQGLPRYNMQTHYKVSNIFRQMISSEWWLLQKRLGLPVDKTNYQRPWHCMSPLLKSQCQKALNLCADRILPSCSAFREGKNMTQYLYSDYIFLTNQNSTSEIQFKYMDTSAWDQISSIFKKDYHVICLNDSVKCGANEMLAGIRILQTCLQKKFPDPCKYEK